MNKGVIKHLIKVFAALAILAACFYFLDFRIVWQALTSISTEAYGAAFLTTLLGTIVLPAVVTWRAMAISSINMSLATLVQINLAVRFYILVLPRAVATGIRWYRYQIDACPYDAAALIAFERVVQLLVVALLGFIFLFYDLDTLGNDGTLLIVLSGTISGLLLGVFLLFSSPVLASFSESMLSGHQQWLPGFVSRRLGKLWASVTAFQRIPHSRALEIVGISLLGYVLFIVSAWILIEDMQIEISLATLIWIRSVVFIVTLIPISIGGIGVRDVTVIFYLGFFGIEQETAFAFSLAILSVQLMVGLIGAALEALRLIRPKQARPSGDTL